MFPGTDGMFKWMKCWLWTRLPSTSFCSLINFGPGKGHGTWGGRRMDRGVRMALKCARPREERWEVPAVYKKPLFFIDRCLPSTHPNLPPHSLACTHPPPQIPPPRPSHLAARPQAHLGVNSDPPFSMVCIMNLYISLIIHHHACENRDKICIVINASLG